MNVDVVFKISPGLAAMTCSVMEAKYAQLQDLCFPAYNTDSYASVPLNWQINPRTFRYFKISDICDVSSQIDIT